MIWPRYFEKPDIPDFETLLTGEIDGWILEDRPLSESEEYLKVIEEYLEFDNAIYRLYRKDDLVVAVYAAYWSPGKTDYRPVSRH
ncbi:MAG: hypothetical protein F6K19_51885, partial [Cyanothece sp. SIO1E1]|nr:hypothetical protein [Cyanothece sp. SIO1E1]